MKLPQILMLASLLFACGDATTPDGGAMDAAMDVSATMDVPTTNIDNPIATGSDGGCSVDGSSCGAGCANCGAGCVSILSDNTNCGGCGNTCGAGRSCQNGMCACAPGNMMCGAQCINTRTDSMHCGACDRACPMGRSCVDGTCQINCTMPTELCVVAGVSTCVNTQSDPSNCGGCGTVCTSANATAACGGGRCSLGPCNRGYGNCDRQAGNGCELNTNSDGANCGGCDNVCPSPPNASASCTAGVCGVGACNRGFGNCDANLANGCEVNTNTSATHCGACGNRCPMGQGCVAGVCVMGMMGAGFQVASLTSANCRIMDADPTAGDDRGGIALTQTHVLLTGDSSTARFGLNDLSAGGRLGRVMDGIFTDLATETAYTLTSGGNILGMLGVSAHIDGIQALDAMGIPTGPITALSEQVDA